MQVVEAREKRRIAPSPARARGLPEELSHLEVLERLGEAEKGRPIYSVMMQVLKYGRVHRTVVQRVEYNVEGFYPAFAELEFRGRTVDIYKQVYFHKWEDALFEVPKEDVERLLEPLNRLGIGRFKFYSSLKVNERLYEAVKNFVEAGKVSGKVFFDEANQKLVVMTKVVSSSGIGFYYPTFVVERRDDGAVGLKFLCTCPWALGETEISGRKVDPRFTGICKHGVASLYYYYPEFMAFAVLAKKGRITRDEYARLSQEIRSAFNNVTVNASKYINSNPDSDDVVLSNIAYVLVREFMRKVDDVSKVVVSHTDLPFIDEKLWKSIRVVKYVKKASRTVEEGPDAEQIIAVLDEKTTIYKRLRMLEELLNGLQGSRRTTLYTKAVLAGLVLGSDLEADPTLVSVVGDPGTGKTLTAEGLARLVGIRVIAVEKEVRREDLSREAGSRLAEKVRRITSLFKATVLTQLPEEKRAAAEKLFEEFAKQAAEIAESARGSLSAKERGLIARRMAEAFEAAIGAELPADAKIRLARLAAALLRVHGKAYSEAVSGKRIAAAALDERRRLLEEASRLGLISRPEDKEQTNSGSVRWEVVETRDGYKVRLLVDLHYLVKKAGGDPARIAEMLEALGRLGSLKIYSDKPGLAALKLSEAEYLEKALRVREEDILSPARRLIWVGGELTQKAVILIDESRRIPDLLEKLLTDLSSAARDTRRTNLVITTDNAEPLMEAETDPRLDAFHSRINFEVITPSTTVAHVIRETLARISEAEREGKTPLLHLDEALVLRYASEAVRIPEKFEMIFYSVPLLLIYNFKVLRPDVVETVPPEKRDIALVVPTPKGMAEIQGLAGQYMDVMGEALSAIRMMPERRFGHHATRAAKVLAILEKKPEVDADTFLSTLEMVLMARVMPAERQFPYLYLDAKNRVVKEVIRHVRGFIEAEDPVTLRLIEILGSLQVPDMDTLKEALEEMAENPVAAAVFLRFLEQMLVSEQRDEFLRIAEKVPGLYTTLEMLARLEKIPW